jgi:glycosyltransferase involved in cell wall biosynthesis
VPQPEAIMAEQVSGLGTASRVTTPMPTLICFSHLRWNFVFQRPQHLLTRAAKDYRVIFFEEPIFDEVSTATARIEEAAPGIRIVTPVIAHGSGAEEVLRIQRTLLDQHLPAERAQLVTWYYTPMALRFSRHIAADICVYDCMDELSAFKNAPAELNGLERELFERADLVFTGGQSLYEAKRAMHRSIYPLPSSIDTAHFARARLPISDPADQANIPHPRVGFFGVIDERLDIELVASTAAAAPDLHFLMIGPVVKIDPASLPVAPNLHWLGPKSYAELPGYLGHWDVGWMPFSLNQATRYISPTKTPEFLAAGMPVLSTAIVDVVRTYGAEGLVDIVDADDVETKLRAALDRPRDDLKRKVDAYLANMSWDRTWSAMSDLMARASAMESMTRLRKGA